MSFRTLKKKAYYDTMLSPKYFSEKIRYLPWYRQLDAIERAVLVESGPIFLGTFSSDQENPDLSGSDQSMDRVESVIVQCTRDPRAMDSKGNHIGGIDCPTINDAILRGPEFDPLQIPYYFVREMKDSVDFLWRLVFERHIHGIQGAARGR